MGATLRCTASHRISGPPRFLCAVFGPSSELAAQAAHIPVHLGSMAYAMRDLVRRLDWQPGDMIVVNDPYLGGHPSSRRHPDRAPVSRRWPGRVLRQPRPSCRHRWHLPGLDALSRTLDEEGLVLSPRHYLRGGQPIRPPRPCSRTGCATRPLLRRFRCPGQRQPHRPRAPRDPGAKHGHHRLRCRPGSTRRLRDAPRAAEHRGYSRRLLSLPGCHGR